MAKSSGSRGRRQQDENSSTANAATTAGILGTGLASGAGGFTMCPVDNQSFYCKFMRFIHVIRGIIFLIMVLVVIVVVIWLLRTWLKSRKRK